MQLAILFWFFKDLRVCENRLRILRKRNPHTKIYGLYGGPVERSGEFAESLGRWLDDFYCFDARPEPEWKWRNGDLVIAEWFRRRGRALAWDSVVVVQWDMLVLAPVDRLFAGLPKDAVLLSGAASIESEGQKWAWVTAPEARPRYGRFLAHLRERYGYRDEPMFCIFIVVVLSRAFLEKYSSIDDPELGFIEYRVPMYAQAFGIPVVSDPRFTPSVEDVPTLRESDRSEVALTVERAISLRTVWKHMARPRGARVFHPFRGYYPAGLLGYLHLGCRALDHLVGRQAFSRLRRLVSRGSGRNTTSL